MVGLVPYSAEEVSEILRPAFEAHPVETLEGRGAAAARQQRRTVAAESGHGGDGILDLARDDDPDRHLAVVRGIGRVERAAAGIEPHPAFEACTELRGQASMFNTV